MNDLTSDAGPSGGGGGGGGGNGINVKVLNRLYEELQEISMLLKEISPNRQMSDAEATRITAEVKLRESLALSARKQIVPAPPKLSELQRFIESRRAIGFQRLVP